MSAAANLSLFPVFRAKFFSIDSKLRNGLVLQASAREFSSIQSVKPKERQFLNRARILVADDHKAVLASIVSLLEPEFAVVGAVADVSLEPNSRT